MTSKDKVQAVTARTTTAEASIAAALAQIALLQSQLTTPIITTSAAPIAPTTNGLFNSTATISVMGTRYAQGKQALLRISLSNGAFAATGQSGQSTWNMLKSESIDLGDHLVPHIYWLACNSFMPMGPLRVRYICQLQAINATQNRLIVNLISVEAATITDAGGIPASIGGLSSTGWVMTWVVNRA